MRPLSLLDEVLEEQGGRDGAAAFTTHILRYTRTHVLTRAYIVYGYG